MGSNELRLRENWQTNSGSLALATEQGFSATLNLLFKDTDYCIIDKPKQFEHIYENWPLSLNEIKQIYNPEKDYKHGFQPDCSIKNVKTEKTIFVEVKRQDGWVEGLPRSAGRGNAHERLCKYFTPGLQKILAKESKIVNTLPFWIVFTGNITRDPCRVREITCWFDEYNDHFFFWRNNNPEDLCNHFIDKIAPILD